MFRVIDVRLSDQMNFGVPRTQVASRGDERWRFVPYDDGCFTVLLGEPMQKWSNDRWFAPLHCAALFGF